MLFDSLSMPPLQDKNSTPIQKKKKPAFIWELETRSNVKKESNTRDNLRPVVTALAEVGVVLEQWLNPTCLIPNFQEDTIYCFQELHGEESGHRVGITYALS